MTGNKGPRDQGAGNKGTRDQGTKGTRERENKSRGPRKRMGHVEGDAGEGEVGAGAEGAAIPEGADAAAAEGGLAAGNEDGGGISGRSDCGGNEGFRRGWCFRRSARNRKGRSALSVWSKWRGRLNAIWCMGWCRGSGRWRIVRWSWWNRSCGERGIRRSGSGGRRVSGARSPAPGAKDRGHRARPAWTAPPGLRSGKTWGTLS